MMTVAQLSMMSGFSCEDAKSFSIFSFPFLSFPFLSFSFLLFSFLSFPLLSFPFLCFFLLCFAFLPDEDRLAWLVLKSSMW